MMTVCKIAGHRSSLVQNTTHRYGEIEELAKFEQDGAEVS